MVDADTMDIATREAPVYKPLQISPADMAALQERVARMAAEAAADEAARSGVPAPTDPIQQRRDMDAHRLGILGFAVENLAPEASYLPDRWQQTLATYTSSLGLYVRQGIGIIASSSTGGGKSTLLALIAREAAAHDLDCAYLLNGSTLLYQCRLIDRRCEARAGSYDTLWEDVDDRKHWPHEKTALVLADDMDYFSTAGYDAEARGWATIGEWLYWRMAQGLATCVATNLPVASIETSGQKVVGLLDRPGMERVRDRATRFLPQQFRLLTGRASQRTAE